MRYELNNDTLALIPNGKKGCQIINNKKTYNLTVSTFKVIEKSCDYYGVSYNARVDGSRKITNAKYKNPILIEETQKLVFFPISSPKRTNAYWVCFNNIFDYKQCNGGTKIKFKNGEKMDLDISYYIFNNQFLKAAKLYSTLIDRSSRKIKKTISF